MNCPKCGRAIPEPQPRCERCDSLEPTAGPPGVTFRFVGSRYAIGQGSDFYGIWDLVTRGSSLDRFTMTRKGWSAAWSAYSALEEGYRHSSMSIEHRADFVVPHPVPLARRVLVALGGLAIVVSALLPWIGAPRVGHDTLLGFASAAGRSSAIAWLVPALGVLAILVALTLPGAVRALGVALGLLVLAIACYLFLLPLHGLTQAHVIADVGAGAWIAVTGSALMILGGAVSG